MVLDSTKNRLTTKNFFISSNFISIKNQEKVPILKSLIEKGSASLVDKWEDADYVLVNNHSLPVTQHWNDFVYMILSPLQSS